VAAHAAYQTATGQKNDDEDERSGRAQDDNLRDRQCPEKLEAKVVPDPAVAARNV